MNRAAIVRLLALSSLFVGQVRAQSPPAPHQDRSFNLGQPVPDPENLSGIWEASDGHGGAVGLHLILDTTTPVDVRTLTGVPQKWLGLSVGLYRRSGPALQTLQENSFSDSPRGGSVHYQDDRLTLHVPGYDLDLRRIPGDRWSGRFHRLEFDANVTVSRPTDTGPSSWFVGTWKTTSGVETTCLHVAQSSPGTFLAWSDTLRAWGAARFESQGAKPPYSWQRYGDLVGITPAGKNSVWVEFGTNSGTCCPHRFLASQAGGKGMNADWPTGLNQSAHKSRWTRIPGDSCVAPAP